MLISSLTCEYLCMAKPEGESEKNTCLPNIHHPLKKQEVGAKKTPLRHKLKIHVYFFPQENKMHQTPKTLNSLGLNTASSRLQILKWASKALQLIRADLHQNQHRSIPAVHLYHHSFLKVPSEVKTFLLFFFFLPPQDFYTSSYDLVACFMINRAPGSPGWINNHDNIFVRLLE